MGRERSASFRVVGLGLAEGLASCCREADGGFIVMVAYWNRVEAPGTQGGTDVCSPDKEPGWERVKDIIWRKKKRKKAGHPYLYVSLPIRRKARTLLSQWATNDACPLDPNMVIGSASRWAAVPAYARPHPQLG